jgi:hypothetical protein
MEQIVNVPSKPPIFQWELYCGYLILVSIRKEDVGYVEGK